MIFKGFRNLLCVLGALCGQALAAGGDDALSAAYDAYRAGDAIKLARQAKTLEGQLLEPWVDYWRLALGLEDAPVAGVREFLAKYANTYVAERLRTDWLRVLGKRGDWQEFDREAALYARDEPEIRCYRWLSRLQRGDDAALAEAQPIWLEPRELSEGCGKLADAMVARDYFSLTDIWRRVRVLFGNGQITAAKTALAYLPRNEAPDERLLAEAARQPKRLLDRLPKALERRATREVVVLAGMRYARNDPQGAAELLAGRLSEGLPEREVAYLWGRVGYEAAREHHAEALKWYARAGDAPLDDAQLAWQARAALRAGTWRVVRDSIDRMSGNARKDPAWHYWYARALAAQGDQAGARAYYLRIAGQADFYGLLASEELGYMAALPQVTYIPGEDDIEAVRREPGLARGLELIRLGVRVEGVREWLFTIRSFDDAKLLAAAELARRAEVYDRAIHTAERTARVHNYALRYPVPFHGVFREYAKSHGLDESWVLGVVRQESRFIAEARSSAGAAGLMQLMPGTARYVARKIGLRNYRPKNVTEIETNVTLGTGYLRMVLDELGHPVLASAAYNAGPGRARRWRDAARPLEGAIYAETIPFAETRDYVKKVMANAVFYAALIDNELTPLKARLGMIPARVPGEPVDEELP